MLIYCSFSLLLILILTSGTGLRNIIIAACLDLGAGSRGASVDGNILSVLRVNIQNCEYRGLPPISIYESHIYGFGLIVQRK